MIDDPLRIAAVVAAIALVASPYAAQICKLAWDKVSTTTSKKDLTQDIHTIVSIAARLKDCGDEKATEKARELIDLLLGGASKK